MAEVSFPEGYRSLSQWMEWRLWNSLDGYYQDSEVIGPTGDFTTAPELTHLFGACVAVWIGMVYRSLGSPSEWIGVEYGPGRGTLARDIWRVLAAIEGCREAMTLYCVERSPTLRRLQETAFSEAGIERVHWVTGLEEIPIGRPIIGWANEWLDALPIDQWKYDGATGWREWGVETVSGPEGSLVHRRVLGASVDPWGSLRALGYPDGWFAACRPEDSHWLGGEILEVQGIAAAALHGMASRIASEGGGALWLDYGYDRGMRKLVSWKDTLQGVLRHAMVPWDCASCDLSSHVDFGLVRSVGEAYGLETEVGSQASFLGSMGFHEQWSRAWQRTQAGLLASDAPDAVACYQRAAREWRLVAERLLSPRWMGRLFQAVSWSSFR
jgi:NADH dehydrogenase [ubiquinone] 1 alpha subcomplex assembly factor 7